MTTNRNLPPDLDLLPELYKQFNLLSLLYLQKHYPECERENYNNAAYLCTLHLFAEAALGTENVIVQMIPKHNSDNSADIYIKADSITGALREINLMLDDYKK